MNQLNKYKRTICKFIISPDFFASINVFFESKHVFVKYYRYLSYCHGKFCNFSFFFMFVCCLVEMIAVVVVAVVETSTLKEVTRVIMIKNDEIHEKEETATGAKFPLYVISNSVHAFMLVYTGAIVITIATAFKLHLGRPLSSYPSMKFIKQVESKRLPKKKND